MEQTSPWVPQENGTYLPSADLVKAVRENPDQYPNAVDDFTALSGLPREEVEAIIRNPMGSGGMFDNPVVNALTYNLKLGQAAVRGVGEAAGWATKKLVSEDAGQFVQDAVGRAQNPVFDTERDVGEKIAEVAGQAAPAVAGGVAAGGVIAGGVVGAGISTLTFGDEDNVANLANDYADNWTPDILVIQDEDDADTRAFKNMASNLIVDLATAGLGHGIAKVYRLVKEVPSGFVDMNALKQMGDELGVNLRDTEGATSSATKALENTAIRAVDEVPPQVEAEVITKAAAREKVAQRIYEKETGTAPVETPATPEEVQAWRQETLGPIQRDLNRSKEVNVGLRQHLKGFEEGPAYSKYAAHSEQVMKAVNAGNYEAVIKLSREIDKMPDAATVGHVYKTSVLRASLDRLEKNFEVILERIREDPSIQTKVAWKELAEDFHANKVKLAEEWRNIGHSSAYAFLTRKGVKFDDSVLASLKDGEAELAKELREKGYTLFSSKAEFMSSKMLNLKEMGYDPLKVLSELNLMFDEFDKARAGVLDNLKHNKLAKLTKAEREHLEGSFMRWLNDMRNSAMLGQPSTSFLEALSNTIQNASLPITQHVLRGNIGRAYREYLGYGTALGRTWDTFKKSFVQGKGVMDDFDVADAQRANGASLLGFDLTRDYTTLANEGKWARYVFYRLWDFASTLSIASSEASKALRGAGLAYADGLELALKQGATKPQAKKMALEYAQKQFNPDGSFKDAALRLDVQSTAWQSVFDTRYGTGRLAQAVDNFRQHKNPVINVMAGIAVPFWRTLVNIGSNSFQSIQPIPSVLLKPLARTKYGSKVVGLTKFLDDFTGSNGLAAQQRAIGRQRLGYMTMAGGWALMQSGTIDITGPSGFRSWDAKQAEQQEYPASSLIVGGKAIDLTRLLPFSAPLLLLGTIKDMQRENELQMKDGNYVAANDSAYEFAATYGSALGVLSWSLMSDAAAFRGVGDVWDALVNVAKEGDPRALVKLSENYAKQFTPAALRVAGKNSGMVTGDWSQHSAQGFLNEVLASAGFHTGYQRLNFLGQPLVDKHRGLDPMNTKDVRTDDLLFREYTLLNRAGDLGLRAPGPTEVYDKAFWKNLGVQPGTIDWLFGNDTPSLTEMKTKDGANAYDRYRDLLYKGTASADIQKTTGSVGDRIDIGTVVVRKGENLEAALRRTIASPGYQNLTADARAKVFKTIHGVFTKNAKDYLADNLMVDPSIFEGSRYGTPTLSPEPLDPTVGAVKALAGDVQRTRGLPRSLDEIFAITP
ncbi:hypothetical protein J1C56_02315 [Aminobacter anthyllidis]|uniref:Uncharacterized protein n=1 Tax=Aminobacter anthyllidis TaxID=1035067 RepID=A0A9X1A704_9HYPH|nr:hypothetical protein [Aminobacter anthyllidis]MBT1154419.1 hypothetical protein [Aminobacter anthyllidis]